MVPMHASAERTTSQLQNTQPAAAGPRPTSRVTLRRAARPSQVPLPSAIQLKPATGPADDPLEHEADRAADQVMRMPDAQLSISVAPLQISRKCAACEEHEEHKCESCAEEAKGEQRRLRMKPTGSAGPAPDEAPPIVEEVLREPGQPLDAATRTFFELRFGRDFSGVRVHTDENAAESAQAVGARAYTLGTHIAFAASNFAPSTDHGRRLVAHELAHVVQQQGGRAMTVQRDIDRRWVNDVTAARYRGKVMADRIHHHGLLSKEARAKIHSELGYFQGAARESYIDIVQPALRAVKSDLDLRPKPPEPPPPSKEKEPSPPEKKDQPPVCRRLPEAGSGKKCKFFVYDSTLGGWLGHLWEAAAIGDAAPRPATYVIPSGDNMEELLETLLSTSASEDCYCIDEVQFWSHGSRGNGAWISGAKGGTSEITAADFNISDLDKYGDDRSLPGYQEWESKLSTLQRRLMLLRRAICDSGSTVYYRSCQAFQGEKGQEFAKASSRFWRCDVSGHTKSIGLTQPGKHTLSVCQEPDWPVSEGAEEESKKDKESLREAKPK
jgi:hypothetical protein